VADNEHQDDAGRADVPVYEAIGPGWNSGTQGIEDDDGWAPQPAGPARVALGLAVSDLLRSMRMFRFWLVSAAVPLFTALGAWMLVVAMGPGEAPEQAEVRLWAYLLGAALMPVTSSLLALHWGMTGARRFSGHLVPPSTDAGPVAAFFAVAARGPVVAALALLPLLVLARSAGVSGTIAAAAAGVIVLEFAVFGAIGAGSFALFRRRLWGAVVGWSVAGVLVVGNVVAVWALFPAVRADEPVAVAMNVDWGPNGTREAYDCAPDLSARAQIFHTERIVWMMAGNPAVIFVMLAGRSTIEEEMPGWIPASLQEAADGTLVPCINAQPRIKNATGMPLELTGLATQGVLAGAFLAGGHLAVQRRSRSGR
jgi:hypothetical protein